MRAFVFFYGLFSAFVGLGVFGLWVAVFHECGIGCGILFSIYAIPVGSVCFLPIISALDDRDWK